jgi:Tfp pilus assembly protein PilV
VRNQGFTVIEVLIAAAVVTCGLVAVASMFSFAVRANVSNRQMAIATALLYDKMEQFKSTPLDNPLWNNPDGFDYVTRETTYVRVWQVSAAIPRTVTITVYAENAMTRRNTELIRATAVVSNTF